MTFTETIYRQIQRFRNNQPDVITRLPIVILMPHSACNCRCVMCDIWKGNSKVKYLTPDDLGELLPSLKKFGTKQVLLSGGEALLNPTFFQLCDLLKKENIHIILLSTGMTIARHANKLVNSISEIIVSLDGDEQTHNLIRNVPDAFSKLETG